MLTVDEALERVRSVIAQKARAGGMPAESIPLTAALGRVLREPIVADSDYPRFDKATRDGYAVRFEDVRDVPSLLEILGESRAGQAANVILREGTCCEIMTGAPLPEGATAVVMVEHTERVSPTTVRILRSSRQGEGLLRQGAELREGETVLHPGRILQIADIGTLASVGKSHAAVSQKPRVAILVTGDELVEVDESPRSGEIRNSNSYTLHAQVLHAGAEPVLLGIGRDSIDDLQVKIREGLQHDLLLVSGGVSMGKYDYVEDVFSAFGVETVFTEVAMKPGKPTVFGHRGETFVFGLPGNPVSTIVAFRMFVVPVIQALLQVQSPAQNAQKLLRARLEAPAKCDPARAAIVPALVRFHEESFLIQTAPWKGSSDLAGLSRANALVVIPRGSDVLQPGQWVEFLSLE